MGNEEPIIGFRMVGVNSVATRGVKRYSATHSRRTSTNSNLDGTRNNSIRKISRQWSRPYYYAVVADATAVTQAIKRNKPRFTAENTTGRCIDKYRATHGQVSKTCHPWTQSFALLSSSLRGSCVRHPGRKHAIVLARSDVIVIDMPFSEVG
jgi:hypothetical protein